MSTPTLDTLKLSRLQRVAPILLESACARSMNAPTQLQVLIDFSLYASKARKRYALLESRVVHMESITFTASQKRFDPLKRGNELCEKWKLRTAHKLSNGRL